MQVITNIIVQIIDAALMDEETNKNLTRYQLEKLQELKENVLKTSSEK